MLSKAVDSEMVALMTDNMYQVNRLVTEKARMDPIAESEAWLKI